jgi:hypothetical protein
VCWRAGLGGRGGAVGQLHSCWPHALCTDAVDNLGVLVVSRVLLLVLLRCVWTRASGLGGAEAAGVGRGHAKVNRYSLLLLRLMRLEAASLMGLLLNANVMLKEALYLVSCWALES